MGSIQTASRQIGVRIVKVRNRPPSAELVDQERESNKPIDQLPLGAGNWRIRIEEFVLGLGLKRCR